MTAAPEPLPGEASAVRMRVTRIEADGRIEAQDWISAEVPVEVSFDRQPFAVMMASPTDLEDFAYGFARSEAGIGDLATIASIEIHERLEGIQLDIRTIGAELAPRQQRQMPGRSGCGICGSRTLEEVVRVPPPIHTSGVLAQGALQHALTAMRSAQPIGQLTGSLHAAAWFSLQGELQLVREDVGRHNALDKLLGAMWRRQRGGADGFLVVTSRASYEMVTKAATAGVAIMVAISAPTALAVRLADSCGLTLIGFARPGRCLIYTHDHRFSDSDNS